MEISSREALKMVQSDLGAISRGVRLDGVPQSHMGDSCIGQVGAAIRMLSRAEAPATLLLGPDIPDPEQGAASSRDHCALRGQLRQAASPC